jgi:hypothetical protein
MSATRRDFLSRLGGGLGGVALAQLLGDSGLLAATNSSATAAGMSSIGPHHRPKARRIIQLFMNGGVSQMDVFDYKPALLTRHGQRFEPGANVRVEAATSEVGTVLKPMLISRSTGQSGRWVSSAFPHLARCVDDLAFLMAMTSRTNVHGPGSYLANTGFLLPGFPCVGHGSATHWAD